MAQVTLTLLGGFSGRIDRDHRLILPTRRSEALLAYLALPAGQPHSRDKLTALLWGDLPRQQARGRLRQALFAIRNVLNRPGPPAVLLQSDTVALNREVVSVDAVEFERLAVGRGPGDLEKAALLYQGELLAGLAGREAAFEEWLIADRQRLHELAVSALTRLLALQRQIGAIEDAVQTALKLLRIEPPQEAVHRALMRLYVQLGRPGAALRQYRSCAEVLHRELTAEPEAETQELYREVVRQQIDRRGTGVVTAVGSPHAAEVGTAAFNPLDLTVAEAPFLGRMPEMGRLRERLLEALQGRGGVVAVLGESGIGKSRLVMEAISGPKELGVEILLGRCHESQEILPFGPWAELLRTAVARGGESLIDALPAPWRAALSHLIPDVVRSNAPLERPDQLQLFESAAHVLGGLAAKRPLLIVLEDVQWADEISLRLLSFIGQRIQTWPALVIATARTDDFTDAQRLRRTLDELESDRRLDAVALTALSREDTVRLASALAPSLPDVDPKQVGEQIWRASSGNPFVAVETLRAWRNSARGDRSVLVSIPHPVRRLIESRLQRLGDSSRLLVATAAVIEGTFSFELLRRATALPEHEIVRALEELVRRGVFREVDDAFAFVHDRVREIAYGQLLTSRRRLLHRKVGEALEAVHSSAVEQHWAILGAHYEQAGAWDDALQCLIRAGTQAREQTALHEAVSLFERALRILEHLRDDDLRTAATEIDLRLALDDALVPLGKFDAALEHLRLADELTERLGDERRQALVAVRLCDKLRFRAEYARSIRCGELGLGIATTLGDTALADQGHLFLGMTHHVRGEYISAIEHLTATLSASLRAPVSVRGRRPYLPALARLAWCCAEVGQFAAAHDHAHEALRIAQDCRDSLALAHATLCLGIVYLEQGDPSRAIPALESSVSLCRAGTFGHMLPHAVALLAVAHSRAESPTDSSLQALQAALECEASTHRGFRASRLTWICEALAYADRMTEASAMAHDALAVARAEGERGGEARALYLIAELARQWSSPDQIAATTYREALTLAEALGMRPLAARCHAGLGGLRA